VIRKEELSIKMEWWNFGVMEYYDTKLLHSKTPFTPIIQ
jgi:hypothetical protein